MSSQLSLEECKHPQISHGGEPSSAILNDSASTGDDSGLPLDLSDTQTKVISADVIDAGSTSHLEMLLELETMRKQLKTEREEKRNMEEELSQLQIQKDSEVEEAKARITGLADELELEKIQRADLNTRLIAVEEKRRDENKKAEELLNKTEVQLKESLRKVADGEKEVEQLQKVLESVKDTTKVRKELEKLRKEHSDFKKNNNFEVVYLKAKCERLTAEVKKLENAPDVDKEIARLKALVDQQSEEKKKADEMLKEKDCELETMRLQVEDVRKKQSQFAVELECLKKKKAAQKEEEEQKRVEELLKEADQAFAYANRGYKTLKIETRMYQMRTAEVMATVVDAESSQTGKENEEKLAEAMRILSSLESANKSLMQWTEEAMQCGETRGSEEAKDREESGEKEDQRESADTVTVIDEDDEIVQDVLVSDPQPFPLISLTEEGEEKDKEEDGETIVSDHDEVVQDNQEVILVEDPDDFMPEVVEVVHPRVLGRPKENAPTSKLKERKRTRTVPYVPTVMLKHQIDAINEIRQSTGVKRRLIQNNKVIEVVSSNSVTPPPASPDVIFVKEVEPNRQGAAKSRRLNE